jgi:hypothetical protein
LRNPLFTGFRADNVLAVTISLTKAEYPQTPQRAPFFRQVIQRVKALPGVASVGLTSYLPLGGRSVNLPFNIEGRGTTEASNQLDADIRVTSPDYFRTLGTGGGQEGVHLNIKTMEQLLSDSLAQRRFNVLWLSAFAAVALVLAMAGVYGVMAYFVAQRTHEIGVRIALGARTRHVLLMVVGHGLILVLLGVALGLVGAFALTRTMSSLLYGVSSTDALIFGGVPLLLVLVTLLASYLPARRAAGINPTLALRNE